MQRGLDFGAEFIVCRREHAADKENVADVGHYLLIRRAILNRAKREAHWPAIDLSQLLTIDAPHAEHHDMLFL